MRSHEANNFDGLRLFAALQVAGTHSINWFGLYPATNETVAKVFLSFPGVPIFFVISGFLISQSFLRPTATISSFAKNRARRIYPALWTNLAIIMVVLYLTGSFNFRDVTHFVVWSVTALLSGCNSVADLGAGGFFKPEFYQEFPSGVLWTIPIELSFYVLVPIIFAARSGVLLGASIVGAAALSFVVYFNWPSNGDPYMIPKYLWIFLLGSAAAVYWRHVRFAFEGKFLFWIVAYLAIVFYRLSIGFEYSIGAIQNIVQMLVLAGVVLSAAFTMPTLSELLGKNDISYGLYLWHMPVIWTMIGFGFVGHWRWAALAIGMASIISIVSWKLIEQPILGRRRSRSHPVMPSDTILTPSTSPSQ